MGIRIVAAIGAALFSMAIQLPAGAAAQPDPCAGAAPVTIPGDHRIVMFGELHGNNETPAFVGRVLCDVVQRQGRQAVLLLEWPGTLQPRVDAFMGSAGSDADRAALLQDRFMADDDRQDGRRSVAMFRLLDTARSLKAAGRPVSTVAFGFPQGPLKEAPADIQKAVEESMATTIEGMASENPDAVLLILVGNLHALKQVPEGLPPVVFAAELLVARGLDFLSLRPASGGGTSWFCREGGCGVHDVKTPGPCAPDAKPGDIVLYPALTSGYDGCYQLGPITASEPAYKVFAPQN